MSDPTSLPSFPPPPDEHPLRGRVLDALIDEGGSPALDDEGDVAVTVNAQKLFIRCVDAELPMMRVFGQWRVGDTVSADEVTRLRAANDLSTRLNLVKVGVHGDVLFVAVDMLVPEGMPLRPVLTSTFGAILNTVRMWHEQAGGRTEGADGGAADGPPAGRRPAAGQDDAGQDGPGQDAP